MRVPYLEARSRVVVLATLFCVCLLTPVLLQPASAGVFTVPESQLLNATAFPKGWGTATVTRVDVAGLLGAAHPERKIATSSKIGIA